MPNAAPRPWKMFLPLALVLLLALAWSIYWLIASRTARARLASERAALAEQGIGLDCAQEDWGGYPFHFEFSCRSPVFTSKGKAEMRSGNLLLVALAYAPWQVAALLDGPSRLTGPGFAPLDIEHQRAFAAITIGRDGQPSFSAELPGVSASGLGDADKLMFHTRPSAEGGNDIAVSIVNARYQPTDKPPLAIDAASLLGRLTPERNLLVEKAELQQGQLRYWGSGALSLDQAHRLSGQINTETNDIKALLGVAAPYLDLSDEKRANIQTMLGLLGNAAKAAIIAKDGVLYVGPFKVAELNPLY